MRESANYPIFSISPKETMSSFSPDITNVYWDLEDFPVPVGRCVESFEKNITKVLEDLGYRGDLWNMFGFPSYDKLSTEVDDHFLGGEVKLSVTRKTKFERLMRILTHMLSFARQHNHPYGKCNFIVIAKDDAPDDDGDKEFVTTLSALITLGFNIFLAVPDGLPLAEMPPPSMASRVWYWSDLFDGKSPIQRIGVVEPVGPRQEMVKQVQKLLLSDGGGGDICDLYDLDDDGYPIKREKRMPDEDDDGFPNKREKRMPDEEDDDDDDEQQLMLVIEDEGIL